MYRAVRAPGGVEYRAPPVAKDLADFVGQLPELGQFEYFAMKAKPVAVQASPSHLGTCRCFLPTCPGGRQLGLCLAVHALLQPPVFGLMQVATKLARQTVKQKATGHARCILLVSRSSELGLDAWEMSFTDRARSELEEA